MNVKNLITGVVATATLAATSFASAGYEVTHKYASGHEIFVSNKDGHASTEDDNFAVAIDESTSAVVISSNEYVRTADGILVRIDSYSCEIPSDHASYADAVELAANIEDVQFFYARFSVYYSNPTCQNLERIEYAEETTASVDFFCENGDTYWGQSVYVVGNTEALGNWNPANAIKLDAADYPTWSKALTVEAGTDIEWKCIKREEADPSQGIEWEGGSNNLLNTFEDTQTWGVF